jgi:hypothetical protein
MKEVVLDVLSGVVAMRTRSTYSLILLAGFSTLSLAQAENVLLTETVKPGDAFRYQIETSLSGSLKVARGEKTVSIPLQATNTHEFAERTLTTDAGLSNKTARYYGKAASLAVVDGEKVNRQLGGERRLIVAQRTSGHLSCYSPLGTLTRPELDVVSEHFDTLSIAGLLPGKSVEISDTWKISNIAAQSICLFDGLIEHDLTARLNSHTDGKATITLEGTAKGIENGAKASLSISAIITFDTATKRIVGINWSQKDNRDQGPIAPAAEVETKTIIRREVLETTPDQLSDAALVAVPTDKEAPAQMQLLNQSDIKNRYRITHSRDWHLVGQTENHLVMRFMERGDFVAQATIASWKKVTAGKHLEVEEFQKLIANGWEMEQVVDHGPVTLQDYWGYRITAKGELDGIKVIQTFYAIASKDGEQAIVTFTMKQANANRLGTKDMSLISGIEFPK